MVLGIRKATFGNGNKHGLNIWPLLYNHRSSGAFNVTQGNGELNLWKLKLFISEHNKFSLLMHCIKIESPAKSLLNEQYVFVGGYISFLCVLSCRSEEA